jgi:hypothetical protein
MSGSVDTTDAAPSDPRLEDLSRSERAAYESLVAATEELVARSVDYALVTCVETADRHLHSYFLEDLFVAFATYWRIHLRDGVDRFGDTRHAMASAEMMRARVRRVRDSTEYVRPLALLYERDAEAGLHVARDIILQSSVWEKLLTQSTAYGALPLDLYDACGFTSHTPRAAYLLIHTRRSWLSGLNAAQEDLAKVLAGGWQGTLESLWSTTRVLHPAIMDRPSTGEVAD